MLLHNLTEGQTCLAVTIPASVSHYLKSRPVHGLQCFRYLLPVCRGRAYSATIKCDFIFPQIPFHLNGFCCFPSFNLI